MLHIISVADDATFDQCLHMSKASDSIVLLGLASAAPFVQRAQEQLRNTEVRLGFASEIALYIACDPLPKPAHKPDSVGYISFDELVALCSSSEPVISWY